MKKQATKNVFVGLGNPGKEYENTYHNVGYLALSEMAKQREPLVHTSKYKNLFEYLEVADAVFVWPLTYMNESGKAVREALKKFNVQPENLTVLQDDSDITIGAYKVSFARSSAGHKGVQSIIDILKTDAFHRIRIGIRPVREQRRQKAGEFALKQITPGHTKLLRGIFSEIEKNYGLDTKVIENE